MEYSQLISSAPVVMVEFYATWCPHCKRMAPIVDQVSELISSKARIAQLDIDSNSEAADQAEAQSIPTFIIYADGIEQWRHTGEIEGEALLAAIERYAD